MNLLDFVQPNCIKAPLESSDKQGVINELVDVLAQTGRVADADALKQAVWTREMTRTTGIGQGLAIPHGKCTGVDDIVIAIGKPADAMEFEAIDQRPVRLVVLLASPPDKTSDHIQALAHISRLMTPEEFRDRIYDATTSDEIFELLRSQVE